MLRLHNPYQWYISGLVTEYTEHLSFGLEGIKRLSRRLRDTEQDLKNKEAFLEHRGRTLVIHLLAYSGNLVKLKHADTLEVPLFVQDGFGRTPLHYAVIGGHVGIVEWLVNHRDAFEKRPHEDIRGLTALHIAVLTQSVEAVRILVDTGVNWIMPYMYRPTPLDLTCCLVNDATGERLPAYEEIVKMLVESLRGSHKLWILDISGLPSPVRPTMPVLTCAVLLNSVGATKNLLKVASDDSLLKNPFDQLITPMHIAAENGSDQVLRTLLAYEDLTSWMINSRDLNDNTPLHVAVIYGQLECAKIIWKNNPVNLCSKFLNGVTMINILCRYNEHPAEFLTGLLDTGVRVPAGNGDGLIVDFEILAPPGRQEMEVVSAFIRDVPSTERAKLLQHPLVEAFIGRKWERCRYFYIIFMVFPALFIACLFWYAYVLVENECITPTPRWVLLVCAVVILCHNGLQLYMIPEHYVKQYDTWSSIICGILSFVVGVAGESCPDSMEAPYSGDPHQLLHRRQPSSWVLQLTSIATLLAWIHAMLLVGRFPFGASYGFMFFAVLKNVLKVFVAVVWIVVGFCLSFWILFHDKDQFDNPAKAFVRAVVMMMGEYEYNHLFPPTAKNNTTVNNSTSDDSRNTLLPITSRIVFLGFVMLVSVVLMNLMIGMAVTDIQGLHNESLILRLMKQAEFVIHFEQVISHKIFHKDCGVCKRLKKFLESWTLIDREINVPVPPGHEEPPRGISRELVEKLFEIASKNQKLHERDDASTFDHENGDSLIEAIPDLKKALKKKGQSVMRGARRESSKIQINGQKRCFQFLQRFWQLLRPKKTQSDEMKVSYNAREGVEDESRVSIE